MAAKRKLAAKKFVSPDATVFINRGWVPSYIGFVPSERAWDITMKKLGVKNSPMPKDHHAACHTLESSNGKHIILITIQEQYDRKHAKDPAGVAALIVHECVHAWQRCREHMGEEQVPTREIEAFSVQGIFQSIYDAYLDTRIRRKRK